MLVIVVSICILTYAVVLFSILTGGKNNRTREIFTIKAPSEAEIQKEREESGKTHPFVYPDMEFEAIVRYILQNDPNPRKVVKLIQTGFSEKDRKMLLLCLSINNPLLYNEVLGLLHCDSSGFEEYEGEEIKIEENFSPAVSGNQEMQTGIPASFFQSAMQLSGTEDNIINDISTAYSRLSDEEREEILSKCKFSEKRKRIEKTAKNSFEDIMDEADKEADDFMRLFKASLEK